MSTHELHKPAATEVTPESAGWAYCGLRIARLEPGGSMTLATGPEELAIVPLSGGASLVEAAGQRLPLGGRETVFARVTDWAYVPIETELRLSSAAGCELALASARASHRFDAVRVQAEDVEVELRGAGQATRQITNFMTPEAFPDADKLVCCEVLTPDGNWSSYPPHKHDDTADSPVWNEEIYYFRVGRAGTTAYAPDGLALHRTYTADGSIDATVTVRDGDVFLVPRGYHGPCVAAPGYPLYYLNVMAGPAAERRLAIADDPHHGWIRDTWASQETDPRCPMTTAQGVRL